MGFFVTCFGKVGADLAHDERFEQAVGVDQLVDDNLPDDDSFDKDTCQLRKQVRKLQMLKRWHNCNITTQKPQSIDWRHLIWNLDLGNAGARFICFNQHTCRLKRQSKSKFYLHQLISY